MVANKRPRGLPFVIQRQFSFKLTLKVDDGLWRRRECGGGWRTNCNWRDLPRAPEDKIGIVKPLLGANARAQAGGSSFSRAAMRNTEFCGFAQPKIFGLGMRLSAAMDSGA